MNKEKVNQTGRLIEKTKVPFDNKEDTKRSLRILVECLIEKYSRLHVILYK